MPAFACRGVRLVVSSLVALTASCIPPRIDLDSRAASPYAWYFQVPLETGATLRGGVDLTPGHGACLEQLGGAGQAPWHHVYEPIGSTSLTTFAAATAIANESALLVAANEPSVSVGFVVVGADGRVSRATELALGSQAAMPRVVVRSNDGAVVALTMRGTEIPTIVLVRVDSRGDVVWSTKLVSLASVQSMAWSDAHGLAVAGMAFDEQRATVMVVARLSITGELDWMRELRATGLRPDAAHPTVALTASGAVQLAYASMTTDAPEGTDLAVTRLDAAGSLAWSRRVRRPLPPNVKRGMPWATGVITHAVGTLEESAFVAATIPAAREGSTRLALFELDPSGTVTRQRVVPTSTAKFWAVRPSASNVVVLGETMTPCSFPAQGSASCGGPEGDPGLPVLDHAIDIRARAGEASPGPTRTREVTLRRIQ